ncbi:hypothetical protein CCHL11_02343 [Colletotrichum chlorophyti]|uniref:Uncharacterized protein n=1 Tax=Colletotrichum chlorophyti TaxID=708187 RepID=A0A1Q8S5W4_9PEZI|nr:hypothetical protein CCHL11_02343 [Colletotrichum chlorophyti]
MRSSLIWALTLAGTATSAAIKPTPATTTAVSTSIAPQQTASADSACGAAKAAAESYLAGHENATVAVISPSVAYACLSSVAVDKKRDLDLLNYLEPYVAFQSTLEPLADPPEGYLIPGIDVIGGFGQIRAKLSKDEYKSQLEFALELQRLFVLASDGHFAYRPAILSIFNFRSRNQLVSVSDDGISLPRVYLASDFRKSVVNNTDVYDVESIDGVPVVDWLEAQSYRMSYQDPDAKYNALFTNPASRVQDGGDSFTVRYARQTPDEQIIKFTNGSTYTDRPVALIATDNVPFIGSAESIHEEFEVPVTTTSSTTTATASAEPSRSSSASPTSTQVPGYPLPVAKHKSDWIAGYFLNGTEYKDTAVLAVLAFSPWNVPAAELDVELEMLEANRVVAEFLKKAKETGKNKLIVDVQGNGGGLIAAGFQLYSQLFPKVTDVWDGNRLRANPALNALGLTAEVSSPVILAREIVTAYLDEDRKPYADWKDVYGPEFVGNQNVTNLLRYNQTQFGFPKNTVGQVFEPENMVVVTDGTCGSTCTIFTGLLVREQGVRTIALGGRPLEAPMQAVGGVEGVEVIEYAQLRQVVRKVAIDAVGARTAGLLQKIDDAGLLPSMGEPPLLPGLEFAGAFNYRNAYSRNNVDGYPEQFVYEAAHCRLFYTPAMITNPVAIWNRTADVAWNKGKCVSGSTANSDATIGDDTIPFSKNVISKVEVYEGPGSLLYKGDYERPSPYIPTRAGTKRSIADNLEGLENFEYVYRPRIGDIKESIELDIPEGWEYERKKAALG